MPAGAVPAGAGNTDTLGVALVPAVGAPTPAVFAPGPKAVCAWVTQDAEGIVFAACALAFLLTLVPGLHGCAEGRADNVARPRKGREDWAAGSVVPAVWHYCSLGAPGTLIVHRVLLRVAGRVVFLRVLALVLGLLLRGWLPGLAGLLHRLGVAVARMAVWWRAAPVPGRNALLEEPLILGPVTIPFKVPDNGPDGQYGIVDEPEALIDDVPGKEYPERNCYRCDNS